MRRYDSQDARRRVLAACARLFLERGYTRTRMADILREADISASSFQNIFHAKDGVLTAFVEIMFSGQFDMARSLTADAPTPAQVYAVETALQLALTELNENLRDIIWRRTPAPTRWRSSTGAPPGSCNRRSARICRRPRRRISWRWRWARRA